MQNDTSLAYQRLLCVLQQYGPQVSQLGVQLASSTPTQVPEFPPAWFAYSWENCTRTSTPFVQIDRWEPNPDGGISVVFSHNPGSVECSLDNGPFQRCVSPYLSPGFPAGTAHTFALRAIGQTNAYPESVNWVAETSQNVPAREYERVATPAQELQTFITETWQPLGECVAKNRQTLASESSSAVARQLLELVNAANNGVQSLSPTDRLRQCWNQHKEQDMQQIGDRWQVPDALERGLNALQSAGYTYGSPEMQSWWSQFMLLTQCVPATEQIDRVDTGSTQCVAMRQ